MTTWFPLSILQGSLFICMIGIGMGMAALLLEMCCGMISKDDESESMSEKEAFRQLSMRRMSRMVFE